MFNSRYSDLEIKQWQDACHNPMDSAAAASCHGGDRASMAKGQAGKKQARTANATVQNPRQDDWASECLFDWYNG